MEQKKEERKFKDDLSTRKYIHDSYFYEAEVISHRTDWFLIFHVILLEAFFACNEKIGGGVALLIIGILGILTSYIWLMNGIRGWKTLAQFGSYMANDDLMGNIAEIHRKIFDDRKKQLKNTLYGWARPSPSFAIVIPALWLLAWEGILLCYFGCHFILLSIISMVVISFVIWRIGSGYKEAAPPKGNESD
jgi:hypothetical protein